MTDFAPNPKGSPIQFLEPNGELNLDLSHFETPKEFLVEMYRHLRLSRELDRRAIKLQRQGELGTYAPCEGQEGCQVASVLALDENDPIFPSYRETAALLTRGTPIHKILQYWSGDERGSNLSNDLHIFPVSIPVGSQGLHAVGSSRALQMRDEEQIPIVYFGDGATSEGDLLEALNFAGTLETPVIFFCQNNQWAISVPREQQSASQTLATKAEGFGFDGYRVDGMDPIATYRLTEFLRKRCLKNSEPTFIEAVTYRYGDHTTSDDASRYRSEEELEQWRKKDPLKRLNKLLRNKFNWNGEDEERLGEDVQKEIDTAVEKLRSLPEPDPDKLFEHTFEKLPEDLQKQRNKGHREQNYD